MPFFSNRSRQAKAAGQLARQQLIKREMRFVLQRNRRRFTEQLMARLLDDGCNLHPELARIQFYSVFEEKLAADLDQDQPDCSSSTALSGVCGRTHLEFQSFVKTALTRLDAPESQITAAVIDTVQTLVQNWRQTAQRCLSDLTPAGRDLKRLIDWIAKVNPDGKLTRHDPGTICRRIRIASTAALMRHVRRPDDIRSTYGPLVNVLKEVGRDAALFGALRDSLSAQVPRAGQVMARSFWRTLNSMDVELPFENPDRMH